jgi:hypothetical protein
MLLAHMSILGVCGLAKYEILKLSVFSAGVLDMDRGRAIKPRIISCQATTPILWGITFFFVTDFHQLI